MKKIVKLTEQDLENIVKKVISEQGSMFGTAGTEIPGYKEKERARNVNVSTPLHISAAIEFIKKRKDVFTENYISKPENDQLSGIYNLEKEGRSVINKLNTNYTSFCILLKDINRVISTIPGKSKISFSNSVFDLLFNNQPINYDIELSNAEEE